MNDHVPSANQLLKRAEFFLKSLKPGPLAIATSGGCDSLGVLLAMCQVNSTGREIICFTVDHGLRKEGAAEARFVGGICKTLGVAHYILDWTGKKPVLGIQNAARQARYKLLNDACIKTNAIALVTGHTQNDQLETVAMRARRNTSDRGRGLSGMASATLFYNQMWVLRPFLKTSKVEFQQFLEGENQTWIEDPSNRDERFERVRVRNQSQFISSLSEIECAQELRLNMSTKTAEYLAEHCNIRDGLIAQLKIKSDDIPILLRAIESLIDMSGARNRALSSEQMEKLKLFIQLENPNPSRMSMTLGRTLIERKSDVLVIRRENRNLDTIEIALHYCGLWDGRFWIKNKHHEKYLIVTSNSNVIGFPPSYSWRGKNAQDQINVDQKDPYISVRRYVHRFEQVLSILDMPLATEIARLFDSQQFKASSFVADH